MRVYADYDYYEGEYFGGMIDRKSFPYYAQKAKLWIDSLIKTYESDITESLKMASCAVCEVLFSSERRDGIKSEENDGYRITYDTQKSVAAGVYSALRLYLDEDLFYLGADEL